MQCEIAIVGAGPAGLSFARALAGSGLRVVLVEQAPAASLSSPADDGREIALTHRSQQLMRQLGLWDRLRASEIGLLRDALVLDGDDREGQLFSHREAGRDNLGWLVPNHAIRRTAWEAVAGQADLTLLDGVRVAGVSTDAAGAVLSLSVTPQRAERAGDGWRVQLSDGGEARARTVVDAAGAWADEVGALFGARPIGLEPRRRSAFTFHAPAGVDASNWPMVADVDETWYFKPDAGQLLGSPANLDLVAPHDVQPEELDIAIGIDRLQTATTLEIRRPSATWAGLRSFVRDGEIVIGFDDACPGFLWLAAQGGYGIQSAAGASALAASLIEGAPLPDELRAAGVDPAVVQPSRLR